MRRLLIALVSIAVVFSCAKPEKDLAGLRPVMNETGTVVISQKSLSLIIGAGYTLTAEVKPWNSKDKTITWESSNPEVATVSATGTVMAVAEGEADIKASAGNVSAVCHVTVSVLVIPLEGLSVELPSRSLGVGEVMSIALTLTPENTTETAVWESSDESVATVAPDGSIEGKSPGYVDISVSAGEFSWKETILIHNPNLWLEQVDPLTKPVARMDIQWDRDTICVARGETATVQMLVRAGVAQNNCFNPEVVYFAPAGESSGMVIEPRVNHVRDVRATDHWDTWCGGAAPDRFSYLVYDIPDALLPQSDYQRWLRKGEYCGVWAEFDIPRDFTPGLYEGLFRVSGDTVAELPFCVKVYDVTLPEKQGLEVLQWPSPEVDAMCGGETPEYWSVIGTYMPKIVQLVSQYGQNGFRFLYANGGWQYLNRYPVLDPVTGKYELKVEFDQAYYKREFDMFYENCPDLRQLQGHNIVAARNESTITMGCYRLDDEGHLYVDGEGKPEFIYVELPEDDPAPVKYYLKHYFDGLREMLESHTLPDGRSWKDIYVQTLSDEPNDAISAAYNMLASIVKEVAPDIPVLEPIQSTLVDTKYVDYPCPDILTANGLPRTEGHTEWLYSAMGPQGNYANRFIRIPLLKTRILHWLNYHYDTWGYLHWGLNYWVGAKDEDPWKDAYGSFIAGDMWIIWPGDHKVYSSIRLAAMRDGIRDFDLLRMIEKRSKADADAFCARLILDAEAPSYDMDVKHFRELRRDMLEYLSNSK